MPATSLAALPPWAGVHRAPSLSLSVWADDRFWTSALAGRWHFGESRSQARTPYVCPGRVPGAHMPAREGEYFRWRLLSAANSIQWANDRACLCADDPFDPVIGR